MGNCFNISINKNEQTNIIISSKEPKIEGKDLNNLKSNDIFENVKSKFILKTIFDNLSKRKVLKIIKYNKNIKERLNINKKDYKEFGEIEIEITPVKNKYGKFIIIKKEEESYYHIFFNNNKEKEIKRNYLNENDKITNINIIIDYKVTSLDKLFEWCECNEVIYFKKFNRDNITNMESMFYECSSLKEINLSNFNTSNVKNMYSMFWGCSSLKEINLSKFNINKVTNMKYMFFGCSSELKNKIKAQYKNFREEAFY